MGTLLHFVPATAGNSRRVPSPCQREQAFWRSRAGREFGAACDLWHCTSFPLDGLRFRWMWLDELQCDGLLLEWRTPDPAPAIAWVHEDTWGRAAAGEKPPALSSAQALEIFAFMVGLLLRQCGIRATDRLVEGGAMRALHFDRRKKRRA